MEFVVLGWPADEVTLRLDYRRFSYAGKFVMTNTGKAVVRDPGAAVDPPDTGTIPPSTTAAGDAYDTDVLAAVAFNEDRTDPGTVWFRYVTVREDRRGEGLGPRLLAYLAARVEDRGYDRLRIAVNNPFAYEACYKVGFGYTGERTGLAELVLERPAPGERDPARYRAGLAVYRERDPDDPEASFLAARTDASPPARVDTSA
ncbi:MAG: GNAT family N-acetyltransferase [Haloferacaceae archaeon]